MPGIDASIPLQGRPAQIASPLEQLLQLGQLRAQQQQMDQRTQMMPQELALKNQQVQSGQMEIDQKKKALADMDMMDKALAMPGGRDAIMNSPEIPGHLKIQLNKQFDSVDEAHAKVVEANGKADEARTELFGRAAVAVREHDYDPTAAQGFLSDLKGKFSNDPQTQQQLLGFQQQLQANPTKDGVKALIDPIIAASSQRKVDISAMDAQARLAGANKPTEATLATDAAAGNTQSAAALGLLKPKAKVEPKNVFLDGKPAFANFDPNSGRYLLAGGQDVTDRVKPVPPASDRDPVAQELAQQRLEAGREKNKPMDIAPDIQTSVSGAKYVDGSNYTTAERDKARQAAGAAGAVFLSKEQANSMQEIDNARMNQRDIMTQIGGLLPKDASGRIMSMPGTTLSRVFQTDSQKAAFSSWRTAAIQTLRATAGSKGLRINAAEIAQAIENDIPKLTDTYGVAQQKVSNINTLLDNAERSIVVRDRSTADQTPADPSAPKNPFR